jgi:tetratricopeptide (TPR) repeat protein
MKTTAPGAIASLVCGILSIVLCWVPLVGLVLGIVAIAQYRKQLKSQESEHYQSGGLGTAGLVCGILGTIVSSLYNLLYLFWIGSTAWHSDFINNNWNYAIPIAIGGAIGIAIGIIRTIPVVRGIKAAKRGNVARERGDFDLAISEYSEAIRLDPKNGVEYQNRGNVYATKGDTDKANADYTKARQLGYKP